MTCVCGHELADHDLDGRTCDGRTQDGNPCRCRTFYAEEDVDNEVEEESYLPHIRVIIEVRGHIMDWAKGMKDHEKDYYKSCCKLAVDKNGKACPVCYTKLPYFATGADLRLGDVVNTAVTAEPYNDATVKNIDGDKITVVRPYIHTSDFTYTGGVLPYIGYEEYTIFGSSPVRVVSESRVTEVVKHETDKGRLFRSGEAERRRQEGIEKDRVARLAGRS